jgi:T6SS, Phospholipase effector Tle1-like, catalytic domain
MSKNIILLSDGTGNSNIKDRGTNVFKLYEAIDFNGLHGPKKQVAFYDDGVGTPGTESRWGGKQPNTFACREGKDSQMADNPSYHAHSNDIDEVTRNISNK